MTAFFLAASQWASELVDPLDDALDSDLWRSTYDSFLAWPGHQVPVEITPEISAEEEQAFFALELEDLPY